MAVENPKVFISHASEDTDRFVLDFARKLRQRGIDAWVDKWEILPGDSLVDKIFEEGLKNAQAVIIVLSKNSVNKPWVREELDVSVVRKITDKTKLIPVVIDDCEVPESLRATVWERITDLQNYDESLNRIVSAIYGISQKPPIGSVPQYAKLKIDTLPGLERTDTLVFKTLCELSLETGQPYIDTEVFNPPLKKLGLTDESIGESLDVLDQHHLIKIESTLSGIASLTIATSGFSVYARHYLPDFNDLLANTTLAIVNQGLTANDALAKHLGKPPVLVNYALEMLETKKLIELEKYGAGLWEVGEVTTEGKRFVQNL